VKVLFLVPPTALPNQPSLAAHLLQACAREAGILVKVVYANALLAKEFGDDYRLISQGSYSLVGERLFARAAWGLPPLGLWAEKMFDWASLFGTADYGNRDHPFVPFPPLEVPSMETLYGLEARAFDWVGRTTDLWAGQGYTAAACTSSYEQNNAAFALLGALKKRQPELLTLMGGANAEGGLAEGLVSLDPEGRLVDVFLQGETEAEFVQVLTALQAGRRPQARILRGRPHLSLDELPTPDFSDYLEQNPGPVDLPYETSRGCWWGQSSPCLFCGYEAEKLVYRTKSADRVFADWSAWSRRYPGLRVQTTDLIMPREFFQTLIPRLAQADLPLTLYWEQKADLSWDQLKALRAAKVLEIQPGIETFSLKLLGRLHKGARPSKSVNLLRWASMLGIRVYWNLLWGVPGETLADYEPVFDLLEKIPHLPPPFGLSQLLVMRHSEYHRHPQKWGIDRLESVQTFGAIYPPGADLAALATVYHPVYGAETLGDRAFLDRLKALFTEWNQSAVGTDQRRVLMVLPQGPDAYLLLDTRRLPGTQPFQIVDTDQARALLAGEPYTGTERQDWALARSLAVVLDGDYVPLALSTPEVMETLVFPAHHSLES